MQPIYKARRTARESSPCGGGSSTADDDGREEAELNLQTVICPAPHCSAIPCTGKPCTTRDFCKPETTVRCADETCRLYHEHVINLQFDLCQDSNTFRHLSCVLEVHPHVYSQIQSLELSSSSPTNVFRQGTEYFLQRLLHGLIVHGKGSLKVLELSTRTWVTLRALTQDMIIHLLRSCTQLHTLSMSINFSTLRYSLNFLGSLSGLRILKLFAYGGNDSGAEVINPEGRLSLFSFSVSSTEDRRIFLHELHLGGEAAEWLAEYLMCPECPLNVSLLSGLYLSGAGQRLGSGVAKLLNYDASKSIRTVAWCPSESTFLDVFCSAIKTAHELHPVSLLLLTPESNLSGKRLGIDSILAVLCSNFRIKTTRVAQLSLAYHGMIRERPSSEEDISAEISDGLVAKSGLSEYNFKRVRAVLHGLANTLQRANQDFARVYSKRRFPNLQKIKLWIATEHDEELWKMFRHVGRTDQSVSGMYRTPEMNGEWVSSRHWHLATTCASDMHKTGMLVVKLVPLQESDRIFDQMVYSSTLDVDG